MPLEEEILRDLAALNAKIERHLHSRPRRLMLHEDVQSRRQLARLLEDFRRMSIILLPPEGSVGGICPTCGRQL
jgi:hypothetical protein